MDNKKIIGLAILLLVVVSGIVSIVTCSNRLKEIKRLKANQEALTRDVESYRLADSSSVAQINVITLQKDELKELYDEKVEELNQMNIKVKNLQAYSKQVSETIISVTDTLHDSIFFENNRLDTIQCISYDDGYNKIDGCVKDNIFTGEITSRDTLIQAVHYTYDHYFLFFKWGKRLKQTIRSTNPATTIIADEYIKIE